MKREQKDKLKFPSLVFVEFKKKENSAKIEAAS